VLAQTNFVVGQSNFVVRQANLTVGQPNLAVGQANQMPAQANSAVGQPNFAFAEPASAVAQLNYLPAGLAKPSPDPTASRPRADSARLSRNNSIERRMDAKEREKIKRSPLREKRDGIRHPCGFALDAESASLAFRSLLSRAGLPDVSLASQRDGVARFGRSGTSWRST
jgi:hypothetical protein